VPSNTAIERLTCFHARHDGQHLGIVGVTASAETSGNIPTAFHVVTGFVDRPQAVERWRWQLPGHFQLGADRLPAARLPVHRQNMPVAVYYSHETSPDRFGHADLPIQQHRENDRAASEWCRMSRWPWNAPAGNNPEAKLPVLAKSNRFAATSSTLYEYLTNSTIIWQRLW